MVTVRSLVFMAGGPLNQSQKLKGTFKTSRLAGDNLLPVAHAQCARGRSRHGRLQVLKLLASSERETEPDGRKGTLHFQQTQTASRLFALENLSCSPMVRIMYDCN